MISFMFRSDSGGALRIVNARTGMLVADRATVAVTDLQRAIGLLGRRQFMPGEGLVIANCGFVHMFFMAFPIDLLFCSKLHQVVALKRRLRPWTVSSWIRESCYVVELPVGAIAAAELSVGDQLCYDSVTVQSSVVSDNG